MEQLSLSTETPSTPAAPASPAPSATNGTPATPTSPSKAKKKPAAQKPASAKAPSFSSSTTTLPGISTASLPLGRTETAQSAHKYLKEEGLAGGKEKIKTRANHANLTPIPEKKKGYWSRFGRRDKTQETEEPLEKDKKGAKFSFFSKLSKKTATYMHQLLNTSEDEKKGLAPHEMGTLPEGSSVRFDPPDPRDMPVTFHKPHPDPTLQPVMLKEFSKKLKERYGWSEEDFYKAVQ
ncbi:hypothetical protein EVJ58_g5077 [Rhodofomes roseus]|uniref:Uncharacterized protein n=1 Tax=Rhodofomes roseus TaxID=34475 RepID=A0A4Y9YEY3_9APHY|nr:hypothetical protein EVJ58_g5077 [Rhodofomes roseus]